MPGKKAGARIWLLAGLLAGVHAAWVQPAIAAERTITVHGYAHYHSYRGWPGWHHGRGHGMFPPMHYRQNMATGPMRWHSPVQDYERALHELLGPPDQEAGSERAGQQQED